MLLAKQSNIDYVFIVIVKKKTTNSDGFRTRNRISKTRYERVVYKSVVFFITYTRGLERIRARTFSYSLTYIKGLLFFILKMFVALSSHLLQWVCMQGKEKKITQNFSPETLFLTKF